MKNPSNDQNLTDLCQKKLKEGIIRGEFLPGEKLRIAALATRLKAGPTPIREALSRLASSGLIEIKANRGFFVKTVTEAEVRDTYATFNKIELLALNQAMDNGDTSWEANILAALHKLSTIETAESPADYSNWLALNYEFHCALIAACNSPCLLKIREDLYQLFDRYCYLGILINKNSLQLNNKDHREIVKAVLNREKDRANKLMTAHVQGSLEQVIETLKQNKII